MDRSPSWVRPLTNDAIPALPWLLQHDVATLFPLVRTGRIGFIGSVRVGKASSFFFPPSATLNPMLQQRRRLK